MKRDSLKYSLAVVLFGTIGMFLRWISLPSELVVLCRVIIGALVVWVIVRMQGRHVDRSAVKKNLLWLILSGVALGLNWIFLFLAYLHTTVAIASLCNYLAPVIVVLIAPLLYREKLSPKKLLCVITAVIGVVLISGVFETPLSEFNGIGILFGLLAALGFVGIILCNRKITGMNAFGKVILQLAVSALTVLPYALIRNIGTPIVFDLRSVLLTLMLALIHTGFAYCLYLDNLGKLPRPFRCSSRLYRACGLRALLGADPR